MRISEAEFLRLSIPHQIHQRCAVADIYNGDAGIKVNGEINADQLFGTDKSANKLAETVGTADNKNAGSRKVTVTFEMPASLQKNYVFKDADNAEGTKKTVTDIPVTIEKATLTMQVTTASITDPADYTAENLVWDDAANKVIYTGFITGEDKKSVGITDPDFYVNTGVITALNWNADTAFANAIEIVTGTGNPTNNYQFDYGSHKKGTLTVVPENVPTGQEHTYMVLDNTNSTNVFQNKDLKVFYGDTNAARFIIQSSAHPKYTKIWYDKNGTWTEIKEDGLKLTDKNGESHTFILSNDDQTVKTKAFTLSFTKDGDIPNAAITIDATDSFVTDFANAITFNIFSRDTNDADGNVINSKELYAEVKVDDVVKEGDTETEGSGIKTWYYMVMDTDEDVKFETYKDKNADAMSEADIKALFTDHTFTQVDGKNEASFYVGRADKEDLADPDNYIVFVLVTDNVNNSVLYSSSGIIVDVDFPVLDVQYASSNYTMWTILPGRPSPVSPG